MLKRVHIRGFKSLRNVEVTLPPIAILIGRNTSGKSNFLDALQILSRLGTCRTVKEAFHSPCRGKPIESFSFGDRGLKGLREKESLEFSIEADMHLSNRVVETVNRQIVEMRRTVDHQGNESDEPPAKSVREHDLRYRVVVEMLPGSAVLRIKDEYLAALNEKGEPTGKRKPFIERQDGRIHLRHEGQAHPTYHDRYLDHTILSRPHYPPHHPHVVAARHELENWRFYYFEPRERMRETNPVKQIDHIGLMGEELAAYLWTLRTREPEQFKAVECALGTMLPGVDGIDLDVNDLGEVELRLRENGVSISSRLLSEGTLRILGLLAIAGGSKEVPALVGFEEPENGLHPARIRSIADYFSTRMMEGESQFIATTHSSILPNKVPYEFLFVFKKRNQHTTVSKIWGSLAHPSAIADEMDSDDDPLTVGERMQRGDFDD